MDRVGFAAASKPGEVDEVDILGSSNIEQLIEHEKGVSCFVGVQRVHVSHNAIEAVLHVRDEVFGSADVSGVSVNVLEREDGAVGTSEAEDCVFQILGSGSIESNGLNFGGVGEMADASGVVVKSEMVGRILEAEKV